MEHRKLVLLVKKEKAKGKSVRSIAKESGIPRSTYYRAVRNYKLNRRQIRSKEGTERRTAIKVCIAAANRKPWTVTMVQQEMQSRGYKVGRRKAWQLLNKWTDSWNKSSLGFLREGTSNRTVLKFMNQLRGFWSTGKINPDWNKRDRQTEQDEKEDRLDRLRYKRRQQNRQIVDGIVVRKRIEEDSAWDDEE